MPGASALDTQGVGKGGHDPTSLSRSNKEWAYKEQGRGKQNMKVGECCHIKAMASGGGPGG